MTWSPTPTWNTKLRQALDDAFDEGSITLLLNDYFQRSFAKMASPGLNKPFENRLHEVIEIARMEDWLLDLAVAAHERRPRKALLAELAQKAGLGIIGPRLINSTGQPLEEIVRTQAKFINPATFIERLPQLQRQVCWIDIPGGGGTGFLVGADLVLTNDHVVQRLRDGRARAQDVRCRFDYVQALDGSVPTLRKPLDVALAAVWDVDSKPPSAADEDATLGEAAANESDYALLRLDEALGDVPVGGDTLDTQASPRACVKTAGATPVVAAGNQVFLLQHPRGEPLQLTIGEVVGFNASGTRMRYDANSKDGSSGSPVFDADLNLVALHHARDPADPPKWNQAIPFAVVKSGWKLP